MTKSRGRNLEEGDGGVMQSTTQTDHQQGDAADPNLQRSPPETSVATRLSYLEERSQNAESRISDLQEQLAKETRVFSREKASQMETKVSEMENRFAELEMLLERTSIKRSKDLEWKEIASNQVVLQTDLPEAYMNKIFPLPNDIYSVLATCDWKSFPFWFSLLVIIGFQFSLLVLLLVNQIDFKDDNELAAPANVETTVRVAQALALVIALFSQSDLRKGIEGLAVGMPTIYQGDARFKAMGPLRWYFAYSIRFLQGFVNLFASFVLLVQAESVFDLLLNFLGVQFISDLDDLTFDLGLQGYLGSSLHGIIEDITHAKFLRDSAPRRAVCRGYSNVIAIFAVLAVMVGIFSAVVNEQEQGTFAVEYVTVEFGDEVIPFLGLFNGCYRARKESQPLNRRLVYEQIGSEEVGGKFGFCDNLDVDDVSEGWVFFDGNSIESACDDYILRSGTTKTFDLLDATSNQWYTRDGQLVDYLQVSELPEDSHRSECGLKTFRQTIDSCDQVDVPVRFDSLLQGTRSLLFEKLPVTETQAGESLDATRSHPIYLGLKSSEIILFTGRRWVLTTAKEIHEELYDSDWNRNATIDYFYNKDNKGFRAIERIKDANKKWVSAVSEIVRATTDPGTPFALQWFNVRYESSSTESSIHRNFPFADATRPQEATLGCARCGDDLADCANEGVCVNGTCDCKNRASGVLCRDAPLGDGLCDDFFNKEEFNFDGGDCCASTCTGAFCGANGLSVAFGVDLSNNTVRSQYLTDATMVGFENCKDPSMETFTIELVPIEEVYWPPLTYDMECGLESVTVICDDVIYLRTPTLYTNKDVNRVEQCHEDAPLVQHIHLPAGVSCELSRPLESFERFFEILLLRGNGTDSPSILEGNSGTESLTWSVPSGCLQEVFSKFLGDKDQLYDIMSPQGRAIQTMAVDGTSTILCSFNPELVKERYALAVFNSSVDLQSTNWQEHQCYGWGSRRNNGIEINCNDDDRVVSIKGDAVYMSGGTIPTELSLLSHLSYLDLSNSYDDLTGTLPSEIGLLKYLTHLSLYEARIGGSLPTEIGLLSNLSYLDLSFCPFNGTLPTEIGLLTGLVELRLVETSFQAPIPTEIGQLSKLQKLRLDDNLINWSALPSEIGLLSQLTDVNIGSLVMRGGTLPTKIGYFSSIDSLSLFGRDLAGTLPTELFLLRQLTYLSLGGNDLAGTLPTEICQMSRLERLDIEDNGFTGQLPTELGCLTNLTFLGLQNNNLKGSIPESISLMSGLQYLRLANNDLTGSFPALPPNVISQYCYIGGNCFEDITNALGCDDVSNNCV